MEIKVTITQILPETSGTSAGGKGWVKQEFIGQTDGQYPKKICFTAFNKSAEMAKIQVGRTATVHINLESREYNGKWYTTVGVWKIEPEQAAQSAGVSILGNSVDALFSDENSFEPPF